MSHVETVKSIYAAFGRGDIPAILEALAPQVEWDTDREDHGLAVVQPRRGRDEVAGFFAALSDWSFDRFEPKGFLVGGDQVAVTLDVALTHRQTGKKTWDHEVHLWTFGADGKVARFRHCADTLGIWKASQPD